MKSFRIFQQEANRLSLKFKSREIEKNYNQYNTNKYIWQLRFAHILAVIFYGAAIAYEIFLIGTEKQSILFRTITVFPAFTIGFILTFTHTGFYKKHYQVFNVYYVLVTSISFIYAGYNAPEPYKYSLYSGVIVSLIFNYTFIKQDFLKACISGSVVVLIYYIVAFRNTVNSGHLVHVTVYITVLHFLGIFISYLMEYDGRKSFLMINQIKSDAKRLIDINTTLEEKVKRRTSELLVANSELENHKKHLQEIVAIRTRELKTANRKLLGSNKKLKESNEELEKTGKYLALANNELIEANNELEYLNQLFIGREFRIKELKDKIIELEKKLT